MNNATVTRVARSGAPDDHGDSTAADSSVRLAWAVIAPRSSEERADPRAPAVIVAATLYAPFDADLRSTDVVEVADHSPQLNGRWHVDGIPGPWASPFSGWRPGLEVALRRAG